LSVIVPVIVAPDDRLAGVGETLRFDADAGTTFTVHKTVVSPSDAKIVTVVVVSTPEVVTLNLAVRAPGKIVTEDGTVTLGSLELRAMKAPPARAGTLRVTSPFAELPPTIVVGVTLTMARPSGLTVSVAVSDTPLDVAVMVTT
jgi:hypothetical protein